MMNERIAKRTMELVTEGVTLEEAIRKALEENKPAPQQAMAPEARRDYIASITDIQKLRDAIKIAFAKKSKADGDPIKIERYKAEIKVGQARLREITNIIKTAENPLTEALKYNESNNGIIQLYLDMIEPKLDTRLEEYQKKEGLTKKALKLLILNTSKDTPKSIIEELDGVKYGIGTAYDKRAEKDQRLIKVNALVNLLG